MASRHEIISIDFRANAAKANPAMESLREAAKGMRTEIIKTQEAIENGKAAGMAQEELDKLGQTLATQERKLSSFNSAMDTLSKGVGTLARAIDAFNAGTLQNMSAAFQKASYNAAELAKKNLSPLSESYQKDMAELDALQQKNLENMAKYKLRTEQMLQSIGEGGKISTHDLKQEADGIEELMKLLPNMGHEWMEYYNILQRINEVVKQQTENEKRLNGTIVDANDARSRAAQLSRSGAEDARRQREEAGMEIAIRDTIIDSLKKEREAKQKDVAASAARVQAQEKEIEKARKSVAYAQKMIDEEEKTEKATRKQIDTLNSQADAWENTAKTSRAAVETWKNEVSGLEEQLKGVNAELEKTGSAAPAATGVAPAAASKSSAAAKNEEKKAVEEKTEADKKEEQAIKKKTSAKKEEKKASEEKTEAVKQESKAEEDAGRAAMSRDAQIKELIRQNDELQIRIKALRKEREELAATQKEGAQATKEETNAFKDLSQEQAKAMLEQRQMLSTFKKEGGKWQISNREEAQRYLFDALGEIEPSNLGKTELVLESGPEKISQLLGKFSERYGIQGDGETMDAIRSLMSGGGFVKEGFMNKQFLNLKQDTSKMAAYSKEIKDLTAVINGETKAVEKNAEAKRTVEEVDKELAELNSQSAELSKKTIRLRNGQAEAVEGEIEKNEKLNVSRKKSVDLLKQTIDEYKNLSVAEAKAETEALKAKSTVGYKEGKLNVTNPEEVQSWLIGQARAISGNKGRSSAITLERGQVDKLLESFSKRYGWTSDSNTAKKLLKEIIQGGDGLFKGGGFADFSGGNLTVTIKQNTEAVDKRNAKLQALTAIAEGAAEGIEKMTGATENDTDATKIWAKEVERRHQRYLDMQKEVDDLDEELDKKRKRKRSLPTTGTDAILEREKIDREIETYKAENLYENKKNSADLLKKSWESAAKTLADMMGLPAAEEIQKQTDAENQNAEATEKATKRKRGKKQAAEEAAAAVKEEAKADGEIVKQDEKLNEEDKKRQELLKKKADLEGKIAEKNKEIAEQTEAAAGLDVKAGNARDEAAKKTKELAGAQEGHARALKVSKERLGELEDTQKVFTKTLEKNRGELGEINKEIDDNADKRTKAQQKQAQNERLTIDAMNDAIKVLEARNRAIAPESKEWQENTRLIQQYRSEIDRLKNQPVLRMMTERMGNVRKLSSDALAETKRFWEQMAAGADRGSQKLAVYEGNLKVIAEEERQRRQEIQKPMRENLNNLGKLSTADLTDTKKYWEAVRDGADAGSAAYKKAELAVKALNNEEKRRKDNAMSQYINDQMKDLNSLSTSGLAEVKRYWQAMADGAKRGSDEAKDAANALKRINDLESERTRTALETSAKRISGGSLGRLSQDELRQAISDAKQLQATYKSTSEEARRLAAAIVDAEEFSKRHGVEAERAARKQEEADKKAERATRDQLQAEQDLQTSMRQRLNNLKTLSADSLTEIKKYWEAQKSGAEAGSASFKKAELALKAIDNLERERNRESNEKKAGILDGTLSNYSEAEVREAIEAGKQLVQTYKVGSAEANDMAKKIVTAENYVKQFGIDAERAAQSQAKSIAEMKTQLSQGTSLSQQALKAQENYWQRLIDDPKTAVASLDEYRNHLEQVQELQQKIAKDELEAKGQAAYDFFRNKNGEKDNASANQIEEQRKALIAWRDSLPSSDKEQTISHINQLLKESGDAAKMAAGEMMSLTEAENVAGEAGKKGFARTPQEIQLAIKAIEQQRDEIIKTIKNYRDLGHATDLEEKELADLTKKLRDLKLEQDNFNMSQEKMQVLMETPKSAVNLDELRGAIKRADDELRRMEGSLGTNSKEYQIFAEKVKNAKNTLKEMEGQAKANATAWEKAWNRLKTYVVMYVGANSALQRIMGTMGDMMELSDKMGEVQKTTQMSDEAVGRLSQNLAKLDVRTPLTQLMEISAAAGQLGLKSEKDIQGFTEAANMLMIALPEMGKEAATEMMRVAIATGEVDKIRKQMQDGIIDGSSETAVAMTKIASTIDRLRASSAATAPEITDFVKRVGAVGAQSGISIDQVAALGSTISSLGLRIEMSATALSRMIPAIRRNSFELSQAIGVSPEAVRSLFDAGRGMEAVLIILQRMKDQGMDADSIEKMLGMGGMQEIMKDLNQQGARAGIVFAGLSQNVEQLRRQLGIASQAYEENTAIQKEFNRMNDTTAAKWEKLKNQIEEAFVSDTMQSWLGSAINGVRWLVDALVGRTGLSAALTTILTLIGFLKLNAGAALWGILAAGFTKLTALCKDFGGSLDKITVKMKAMTAAQWTNWILAVVAAIGMLIYKLKEMSERAAIVANEMAKLDAEILEQTKTVDGLFHTVAKTNAELDNARRRLEEVSKANEDTTDAENKLKKASTDHAAAIRDINSKYGQYLGYMLSETSSAIQLANARDLINAKLRETITLKQREAALGNIEQEYGGQVNKKASSVERTLEQFYGNDYDRAARVSVAISEAAQKYANDSKKYQEAVKKILADNKIQRDVAESYMDTFEGYRKSIEEYNKQEKAVMNRFEARTNVARKDSREKAVTALNSIMGDWKKLVDDYRKAEGEEKEKLAVEVYKQQRAYANAVANNAEYFENDARKKTFDKNLKNMQTYEKGLRDVAGEAIRTVDAMERAESKIANIDYTNGGESNKNPWGNAQPADSTNYADMNAMALVNRRKQMKDFVNAIQTDSDVQTVLGEDAALKKAIEKGMSSDMRTVIEWYNTERLKIQDELYNRHLTNTGDWRDPKKSRESWRKQLQLDLDNYLKMLDAYYTKRKAEIQEAGNDEGLTEAEIRNRTLANDTEWQQRRMELQQIYLGKREKVAKDEVTAIMAILAEMDEDTPEMVEKLIGKSLNKWKILEQKAPEMAHRVEAKFVNGVSQSMLKMQQIVHQQMKAIQDIIDKERPFNGITKNLRENLVTMGILTADMTAERDRLMKENQDMSEFNRRQAEEEVKRTTFMLGEAERAYSSTVQDVMRRMADAGMIAWAEELKASPQMQEAMMAQLRATYDAVQDAIKKEASLMKKQAEIMWNNILLPGSDGVTVKDAYEKAIAQLGVDQGRVSRANSLIGAGQASERMADRLAIKQLQLQLTLQTHYYNLMRKQGMQRINDLQRQVELAKQEGEIEKAKRLELDMQHARMSLKLATTKELTEQAKMQEEIIARTEESQARLYKELQEWSTLLSSSMQGVFEASNAGNREYYNERAKMDLTGSGGPGAGTYIVIENEGTEDASAHYEYLDKRGALERHHEIEQQNAVADAWKKVMDDVNMKMSDMITDQINAMLQNEAIDANTQALIANTQAILASMGQGGGYTRDGQGFAVDKNGQLVSPVQPSEGTGETPQWKPFWQMTEDEMEAAQEKMGTMFEVYKEQSIATETEKAEALAEIPGYTPSILSITDEQIEAAGEKYNALSQKKIDASTMETDAVLSNQQKQKAGEQSTDHQMVSGSQSAFAKMTQAANLYGTAYQAMSNDNLSAAQKFEMIAVQAAGQAAMTMLTTDMVQQQGKTTVMMPGILGKLLGEMPYPAAMATFAVVTALMGALMGVAASQVAKSKSQIAQATGASVSAGRLSTGMTTYAEGNVNEFTDPASLTPGRHYNVDGADGRTYRAKYMGKDAKTHITNGPEFHLVGERGQEAIIDAHTTRNIRMNDPEIWRSIQTFYNGGSTAMRRRRAARRGVSAFAEGNLDDFEEIDSTPGDGTDGLGTDQLLQLQASLDRNSDVLERALDEGIKGVFNVYGKNGLIDSYDTGKKNVTRHGERY